MNINGGRDSGENKKQILEEIEQYRKEASENGRFNVAAAYEKSMEIVRKHMNDGWIPVEDRLPEVDADIEEIIEDDDCPEYIVTIRGESESTVLKYSPDGSWFDENGYVYDVIAWCPLPEPYRPERNRE